MTLFAAALIAAGCQAPASESPDAAADAPVRTAAAVEATPAEAITDRAYLTQPLWNDGQAEIAFYQVERTQNQYGRPAPQSFLAGTYVVKHRFDAETMSKTTTGGGTPAFKYSLFYEFESGSYEYKRAWVVNAAQADLAPIKASFTSFDWCSNLYREQAFQPDGSVASLMRSDDYGNTAATYDYAAGAHPIHTLPMLVRALDFSDGASKSFQVVTLDGTYVDVTAEMAGTETMQTDAGPMETEKITLRYAGEVRSLIGETADSVEHYYRGTDDARLLVGLVADSERYRMTLVEHIRSPYWSENLYPKLQRVDARP
ncbi:MAG: hypothetical protein AAGI08_02670 [Bacteroidota bacterium]